MIQFYVAHNTFWLARCGACSLVQNQKLPSIDAHHFGAHTAPMVFCPEIRSWFWIPCPATFANGRQVFCWLFWVIEVSGFERMSRSWMSSTGGRDPSLILRFRPFNSTCGIAMREKTQGVMDVYWVKEGSVLLMQLSEMTKPAGQ